MKVYLANSGAYSDWNVDAVCLREEDAVLLGEHEPIEMDLVEEPPKRVTVWRMGYRGYGPGESSYETWDVVCDLGRRPRVSTYTYGPKRVRALVVEGTDEMAVRKAYSDRVAQIAAEEEALGDRPTTR